MPGGDRTGPMGYGPRTGRGMGFCSGFNAPGYASPGFGRGMGRGFGMGRGRGFGRGFGFRRMAFVQAPVTPVYGAPVQPVYPQQQTKEQETQMLEQEAKAMEQEQSALKEELDNIKKRIEELKSQQ